MSCAQVRIVETLQDWAKLEPHWNRLLAQTPGAGVFQSYEYLQCWWRHFGTDKNLYILVAENADAIAIAPMQMVRSPWLGASLRCLTFMGLPSETDRPCILGAEADAGLRQTLVQFIAAHRTDWDNITLYEQRPQSLFLAELSAAMRRDGHLVSQIAGPESVSVAIAGNWTQYLAAKSSALRKSLKRKAAQLAKLAPPRLEVIATADEAVPALSRYLAVEAASWKPTAKLGLNKSERHRAFWQDVTQRFANLQAIQFKFLAVGERRIAATFGLLWNRRFYSLHICHDEEFAQYSPGVLLTALELEDTFRRRDCDSFDLLGGFLTNKRSWSTEISPSVALYVHRVSLRARIFHGLYFVMKPAFRRWLLRMRLFHALVRIKTALFGESRT